MSGRGIAEEESEGLGGVFCDNREKWSNKTSCSFHIEGCHFLLFLFFIKWLYRYYHKRHTKGGRGNSLPYGSVFGISSIERFD